MHKITIIGAGLAGCEAALWLAGQGVQVTLYEQKPQHRSPAHKADGLAELVCSNSLKAERLGSAGGLLKAEMRRMGSQLLKAADETRVPAGGALAVNRGDFSAAVTAMVESHPAITLLRQEVTALPTEGVTIVASGPLTEGALAEAIAKLTGGAQLSFYDAAAPIVTADSLDMNKIFAASRYGRGGEDDYLNCPMNKAEYEAFYEALATAESAPLHEFDRPGDEVGKDAATHAASAPPTSHSFATGTEVPSQVAARGLGRYSGAPSGTPCESVLGPKAPVYEGCMPVEVMAKRGPETLRYGPLRPVGLRDPRTGHRPWANLQLRKENAEGTLFNLVGFQTNLKFGEQKRVFGMIPGLANAEYARYGVMHRNTFLNSPAVLSQDLSLQKKPTIFFAGQITGFEGYMESAACGLLAARGALARLENTPFALPSELTMCGALLRYIMAPNKDFQPMGANMGLLPPLPQRVKDKRLRYVQVAQRALQALENWNYL